MKVLMVSHSAQPGGSNATIASLLRHRPADVECETVFLEEGPVIEQFAELGRAARVITAGRARQAWRVPGVVRRLGGVMRNGQADVVFAHVTKAHLYASPAAATNHIPYLWWQHERRSQKPLMHLLSSFLPAAAVICSSRWTAAEQRHPRGRGLVRPIHPGAEFEPPPRAHEHEAGRGQAVVVGVVGRLQRWKRVELALEAMACVLALRPNVRLRVVGGITPGIDDDYAEELSRRASELGIADAVDFTGHRLDIDAELRQLDVLLHTAESEPFGLALVEAMGHGVPVVAVAEGGPTEIVRSGVDGLLAEPVADRLAAAIVELADDPVRRSEMGQAARVRALTAFSAQRMAAEAWMLVRSIAGDPGAQRSRAREIASS